MICKSRSITLKGSLENSRRQLFSLRKNINKDQLPISEVGELLLVGVCLHSMAGMAYGHTSPQLADRLSVSRATVETHRKNIYRKLNIHSYYKLVRFAQTFDLV